jgi:hypothetical protein
VRSSKWAQYVAPPVSGRVIEFFNSSDGPPGCTVENLDKVSGMSIYYAESDDGTTWTPISGTAVSIDPGKSNIQDVVSARARVGLYAAGNVNFLFTVDRQINGSPTSLGTA